MNQIQKMSKVQIKGKNQYTTKSLPRSCGVTKGNKCYADKAAQVKASSPIDATGLPVENS